MKKINLKDFSIKVTDPSGKVIEQPFSMRRNIAEALFHPDLKLDGREMLKRNRLADVIENCKEDYILLELADYQKVTQAADVLKGLPKQFMEFFRRIYEAEDVEVEEKVKDKHGNANKN